MLYLTTSKAQDNEITVVCRHGGRNVELKTTYVNWMYIVLEDIGDCDEMARILNSSVFETKLIECWQVVDYAILSSSAQCKLPPYEKTKGTSSKAKLPFPTLESKNAVLSSVEIRDRRTVRVYYRHCNRLPFLSILRESKIKKTLYEEDVPLVWRFVCANNLTLCRRVVYDPITHALRTDTTANPITEIVIPICIFLQGVGDRYFDVKISDGNVVLVERAPVPEEDVALWFCWDSRDTKTWISRAGKLLIYLRKVAVNLLDSHANKNAQRQVLHPYEFAALESRAIPFSAEYVNVLKNLVIGFFGISTQIACPFDMLLNGRNKKLIADAILFTRSSFLETGPTILVERPEKLPAYSSLAVIEKMETYAQENSTQVICLYDFVSHYPNIILALAQYCPRLAHIASALIHFLRLKAGATGMLRNVYKMVLNAVGYGTMGIQDSSMQHYSRPMIEICALVCQISHEIMMMTIAIFEKHGATILNAQTDSLAVRGQLNALEAAQAEVNTILETEVPRRSFTRLDLKGMVKKIVIFNSTDLVYLDSKNEMHGIGFRFNSLTVPGLCRNRINSAFQDILQRSNCAKEFFSNYFDFQKQLRISAKESFMDNVCEFVHARDLVNFMPHNMEIAKDSEDADEMEDDKGLKVLEEKMKESFSRKLGTCGGLASEYYLCMLTENATRTQIPFAKAVRFSLQDGRIRTNSALLTYAFVRGMYFRYMTNQMKILNE